MTTKLQGSASASGLALIGAVVTTVANFGIAWLVSRGGAELAGVFFVATAVVTIAGNSSCLGTMTGMVYFLPQTMSSDDPNPRSLLGVALRPVLVLATTVAAALVLAAPALADLVAGDQATDVTLMLRVLAALVIPWAVTMTLLGATRGLGTMTPTVGVNQILRPALQLIGLGVLFLTNSSPPVWAVAVAWGAPVLAAAATTAAFQVNSKPRSKPSVSRPSGPSTASRRSRRKPTAVGGSTSGKPTRADTHRFPRNSKRARA